MDRLGGTDGAHVAVTLVGEYHVVRPETADSGGHCRCASVGGLDPVYIDVIVCEHGAAYGAYAYGAVCKAHLGHYLGHQLVDDTVGATRAVVHVHLVEELGLAVDLVFLADYIIDFH